MDLAAQHLRRQPCLIRFGAIGAVRPHIAARVIRRQDLAEQPAIAVGRRRHGAFADKAIAAGDGDVRLVAERRDRDHRQRPSIGSVTNLAADLQSPAGVRVLLSGLVRFVRPDIIRRLACLDRRLFLLRVPLFRSWNQGSVDDLAGHSLPGKRLRPIAERGDVALLLQLPIEGFHYLLQRSSLGQFVAEQADRVLVRR